MSEANGQETQEALRELATVMEKLTRLGKVFWLRTHRDYIDIDVDLSFSVDGENFSVTHLSPKNEEGEDVLDEIVPFPDTCIGIVGGEEAKSLYAAAENCLPPEA